MKKYYITRTDLVTGKVTYKKNKTVDGWAGEGFKPYCWRFSKQGRNGSPTYPIQTGGDGMEVSEIIALLTLLAVVIFGVIDITKK